MSCSRSMRISSPTGRAAYATRATSPRSASCAAGITTQSRFYAVESTPTSTGSKSDHRLPLKPSEVAPFVRSLAAGLSGGAAGTSKFMQVLIKDLQGAKGKSIVIAGEDQSPEVHAVGSLHQPGLGNNGIDRNLHRAYRTEARGSMGRPPVAGAGSQFQSGGSAADPGRQSVYSAPPELKLRGTIQMAKLRVRLGLYDDETSEVCQWLIPKPTPSNSGATRPPMTARVYHAAAHCPALRWEIGARTALRVYRNARKIQLRNAVRDYWTRQTTAAISKPGGSIRFTTAS